MKIIKDLITVNNFTKGRKGWEPDRIGIHVTEGSESATESWFDNEASDVSSHYIVSKIGEIRQEVLEEDSAWTQGRVFNPTAKVIREREHVNPNYYFISIEHEGDGNSDLTDAQRIASAELIADIISRWPKIKLDREHIIGHREIYAKKTCPGKIDIDKLIQVAGNFLNKPMLTPKIVYSDYFKDYLIVTKVVSDTEWYFVPFQQVVKSSSVRAQTKLSEMKNAPAN
jgi:N-acetylmuramoyl-L-alanine amidase